MLKRPLRVLHVLGGMNVGGAETLVMNVFRNIDRREIVFDFLVHTDRPCYYDEEIRDLGGSILRLPAPSSVGLLSYCRALRPVLVQQRPGAVHSHVQSFSGAVLKTAFRAGVRVRIAHSHTTSDGKPNSPARVTYRMAMAFWIRMYATHVLGCSEVALPSIQLPMWNRSASVLRNGISTGRYENLPDKVSLRERLHLPPESVLVGHVGRFDPVKNHAFAIGAFADFRERVPDAALVLVGDGPERDKLARLVRARGLDEKVHFLGIRQDVPEILGALDIFIYPSFHEGLPVALVEAQAAGLPCLISDRVTREAELGLGLTRFLPIHAGSAPWCEAMVAVKDLDRPRWEERSNALTRSGYDIRATVRQLTQIYAERTD